MVCGEIGIVCSREGQLEMSRSFMANVERFCGKNMQLLKLGLRLSVKKREFTRLNVIQTQYDWSKESIIGNHVFSDAFVLPVEE